jgi:transposase
MTASALDPETAEPGNASSSAVELPTSERDELIFRASLTGASYREIAEEFGVSRQRVHQIVTRIRKSYLPERYSDATQNLAHEIAILDLLTRGNIKAAVAGSKAAADTVLEAHRRRCKLLGLETAAKLDITVKTAQDIEIERLIAMMGELPESAREGMQQ